MDAAVLNWLASCYVTPHHSSRGFENPSNTGLTFLGRASLFYTDWLEIVQR